MTAIPMRFPLLNNGTVYYRWLVPLSSYVDFDKSIVLLIEQVRSELDAFVIVNYADPFTIRDARICRYEMHNFAYKRHLL